jgi:3',5'-cyclic-AMP phosphodiesterase
VHYVPGEHDVIDEGAGKAYLDRYGKLSKGKGWYSFDHGGAHFVGLVNVFDLKAGGMGNLGPEQLAWLADNLKGKSASTPIVVFAHVPLWTIAADWGWGTQDSAEALKLLARFGSVTVLNGHIHQLMQKVEGNVTFHTVRRARLPFRSRPPARRPRPARNSFRPASCTDCSGLPESPCDGAEACSPSPIPPWRTEGEPS